jgi:hypothetical protein
MSASRAPLCSAGRTRMANAASEYFLVGKLNWSLVAKGQASVVHQSLVFFSLVC